MIIQLISGPRNISTAMMYAFAQRADMSVVDEPMYAYYLNKTGLNHPSRSEVLASQSLDPIHVIKEVIFGRYQTPHVFIKNMSKHMEGVPLDYAHQIKNVFLIRDPEKLIASFSKVLKHPDESEIGLKASLELFSQLNTRNNPSIVLNTEEVLKNPKQVLSDLCRGIGIPFDSSMTSWKAGPLPEDGVWAPYWYKSVHASTGFLKPSHQKSSDKVPVHLSPLLKEVMPYYEELNHHSIKATGYATEV